MSVCTFIASNCPLKEVALEKEYPIEINLDTGTIDDGGAIHKRTISIKEMTIQDIKEIDDADIWNKPDKQIPSRPSFYRLIITK